MNADVAELVDARDLKSLDGNVVWVRVPPPAPIKSMIYWKIDRSLLDQEAVTVRKQYGFDPDPAKVVPGSPYIQCRPRHLAPGETRRRQSIAKQTPRLAWSAPMARATAMCLHPDHVKVGRREAAWIDIAMRMISEFGLGDAAGSCSAVKWRQATSRSGGERCRAEWLVA